MVQSGQEALSNDEIEAGGVARHAGNPPEAVVIVDEVIARSADSATTAPRLTTPLPSGTELVVLEDRGDWLFTQIANNQSAWLPASSVASEFLINPNARRASQPPTEVLISNS